MLRMDSFIETDRFAEARNKDMTDVIRNYNIEVTRNGYLHCPFCNSDRKYNAGVYNSDDGNKFKCFTCGLNISTIDFVMKMENIKDVEAVNMLLDNTKVFKTYNPTLAIEKKQKRDNIKYMIIKNSKAINSCADGIKYFRNRGIEKALNLVNPNQLEIKFNEYNGNKSIIYRFVKQDFVIQKGITKKPGSKRFVTNYGHTAPVPIKSYKHNKYMIVEGIEDGLTALILGYNFITLNSVQNVGHLMELLEQNKNWLKSNIFYECLDNDNAGNECKDKLKAFFSSKNLNLKVSDYKKLMIEYKVKDINELYLFLKKERSGVNIAHT